MTSMKLSYMPSCCGLALVVACNAFQHSIHQPNHATTQRFHCKTRGGAPLFLSQDGNRDGSSTQITANHPDVRCWKSTLENSPNSFVHPSIELAIRPPSEGGTCIIATEDIPADTKVISLDVDEVPVIDAYRLIEGYKNQDNKNDKVMNMSMKLWYGLSMDVSEDGDVTTSSESYLGRDDVLYAVLAHLVLTRYRDTSPDHQVEESFILQESRRLGAFLDSMPVFPNKDYSGQNFLEKHPFPTHMIFWKDNEFNILLNGTITEKIAWETRHLVHAMLLNWYETFLEEHSQLQLFDVINAIESSVATCNSRAFNRNYAVKEEDQEKDDHFLMPLVDKMNHNCNLDYNVAWFSSMLEESQEKEVRKEGRRVLFDIATVRDVAKGEELTTTYGAKKDWDLASGYGFFNKDPNRVANGGIYIMPKFLELDPNNPKAKMDFRHFEAWGPIMKAVEKAVDAAWKKKDPDTKVPFDVKEFPIIREALQTRPIYNVETKLSSEDGILREHSVTIQSILPAFRATASALAQLRYNYQNRIKAPIKLKDMAIAAALKDPNTNWDEEALRLIRAGIQERLEMLKEIRDANEVWIKKASQHYIETREIRINMARDIRDSEIEVLEALDAAAANWNQSVW